MPTSERGVKARVLSRQTLLLGLLLLAVVASALIWRWRQTTPAAETRAVLVVGDQKGGAKALLKAAGELDHVPYEIKWALFPAASPLLEAFDAGAVDVGGIGGAPFAFAYASGAKIKVIAAYRPPSEAAGKASAIIVAKGSPIRTLADLKGKRLATIKGSAGQDLALKLLEKAGLKASNVQWVYLANGEAKAALATGAIDAALVAEQRAIFERYKAAGVILQVPDIDGGYVATFSQPEHSSGNDQR